MATKGVRLSRKHKRNLKVAMQGNKNNWKGGRHINKRGYVMVLTNYYGERKYVLEHRLIMEKVMGRKLLPYEGVHHKNGIKHDNRLSNLEVIIGYFHKAKIRCPYCLKNFMVQ